MKNRIRLTESQLHRVIKEAVNRILWEAEDRTDLAARAAEAADAAAKPAGQMRQSDFDKMDTSKAKNISRLFSRSPKEAGRRAQSAAQRAAKAAQGAADATRFGG